MSDRVVAFFLMTGDGHFQRLRPLIGDLVGQGFRTYVFSEQHYRPAVEQVGGTFVDLFADCPLVDVDAESIPQPCRGVTFAGERAGAIAGELRERGTSLVVYDTFAVVGRAAAMVLDIPYVNVCAGHSADYVAQLQIDVPVRISAACHRAVETLRRLGIEDASPFSYVSGKSPFLNVYCEPPAFLDQAAREALEPVVFYGSLPPLHELEGRDSGPPPFGEGDGPCVYASFGTIVWRYFAREALAALGAISSALASRPDVRGLIGLGRATPGAEAVRRLTAPNVAVTAYADQWRVLADADAFITHQGLNSTHEAVFSGVPMISYPFFGDQPDLAAKAQALGLAVPLAGTPRAPVDEAAVLAALAAVDADRDAMYARLADARAWELTTIADRGSVVQRIVELAVGA